MNASKQINNTKEYEKVNQIGQSLLHIYACSNEYSKLEYCIEQDIDVDLQDRRGKTALHYSAINKNYNAVCLLLANKARTDIVDVLGYTALWDAVLSFRGQTNIIMQLMLCSSDKYAKNISGTSILEYVKNSSDKKLIDVFNKFNFVIDEE